MSPGSSGSVGASGYPSAMPEIVRAFMHRRDKRYSEGLAALESVQPDFKPWMVDELKGHFLDKLGDANAAFAAFKRMNDAAAAEPEDPVARAKRYRSQLRARLDSMTEDWLAGWKAAWS